MEDYFNDKSDFSSSNYIGFVDIMSILLLVFILVISMLFIINRSLGQQINNIKTIPKTIIIPNELNGKIFFNSGSSIIRTEFYEDLDNFIEIINQEIASGEYNFIQIEGHTDNDPILFQTQYKDNWELGAARAISVVRYFILKGISPEILSAVSHSEFKPSVIGNTKSIKKQNRRIEITLLRK